MVLTHCHIGEGDWLYFERAAERYHDMRSNYITLGTCLLLVIQNHIRLANYKHRSAMDCWWMGNQDTFCEKISSLATGIYNAWVGIAWGSG